MRYFKETVGIALSCMTLTSCFKDEPLNAECDIEEAFIHTDKPEELFENITDTLVKVQSNQDAIIFTMAGGADITALAPQFKITEGASISPASGSIQDFSKGPITYTVTSEDKKWTRTYQVSVQSMLKFGKERNFDFAWSKLIGNNKYASWYELWNNGNGKISTIDLWSTGNPGFNISNPSSTPDQYPTIIDGNSYDGAGVKLITRRTSKIADMVKKPIAAGNLFIGQFDPQNALQDAMKATKFGTPFSFSSEPITFSGYYKYQPGDVYTDKNMNEIDRVDKGTIYAVLYDNHDENGTPVVLYGDNVQTSSQVVALARLDDIAETPEWTHFSIPFIYQQTIDATKLQKGGYSLAIVCSSSTKGAEFMGAVGSTLWVDKFNITCK